MKLSTLCLSLLFFTNLFSQYVLGKGLYLGVSAESGMTYLFETETVTEAEESQTFKGLSYALGFHLIYSFNFKQYLMLETMFNRNFIPHKISQLTKTNTIKGEPEFILSYNKYRLAYLSGIQSSSWLLGGGVEGMFFNTAYSDKELINLNESVNGLILVGLKKNSLSSLAMIYISYSIPLTYLKKSDDYQINQSSINLHIKYSIQLF